MNSNAKALSGLSYLSIFFLPFIFPIIIFFGTKDIETRRHAKRALISHVLTIVLSVILVAIMFFGFMNTINNTLSMSFIILLFFSFILCIIAFAAIFIWNIVQAVKIIR